jgi:Chaperone of endosialidase
MRGKKDIAEIPLGLDFSMALRPVAFRLINGNDRIDFGFISQEIESLLGVDYNVLGIGGTAERKLSLHYTDFVAPMVKAMQKQQEIIEQQQAEISTMKAHFAIIEAVLAGQSWTKRWPGLFGQPEAFYTW